MIQKIGKNFDSTLGKVNSNETRQTIIKNQPISSPQKASANSALLQAYYVTFTGETAVEITQKQKMLQDNYTKQTHELIDSAGEIAKKYGHAQITEDHIQLAALKSVRTFMDDVEAGSKELDLNTNYMLPNFFAEKTTNEIYKDKKLIKKTKGVFDEEIQQLEDKLAKIPKTKNSKKIIRSVYSLFKSENTYLKPKLSKDIVINTYDLFVDICSENQMDSVPVHDAAFLNVMMEQEQNESKNNLKRFITKLSNKIMIDEKISENQIHLSIFDKKAENILKNLSLGRNMIITHDNEVNPQYLIDSIHYVLDNQDNEIKNINKNNTQITIFNEYVRSDIFSKKIKKLGKDESNNHILVLNMDSLIDNEVRIINGKPTLTVSLDFLADVQEPPKNVKLIFFQNKDMYYTTINNPLLKDMYNDFGEIALPALNIEQTKQAFKEQSKLMEKIGKAFSLKAINKAIDVSAAMEGAYPEKAQNIMKKIASNYIDRDEITAKDVEEYVKKAKNLFKSSKESSSFDAVLDTGKKLKDLIGKEATKKEAESIIKQIKKGTLGTRGVMIYPQDGSVGSGRKVTAKAIAGETSSPYFELDALDFGTRDVNLFGDNALSSEAAIKKLFSMINAQAEASPNKSAVVLIENFKYLPFGEMVSEYYQKSMSQLSKEMNYSSENGLNILILGSVEDSYVANACSNQSLKFIDKIEVESPARNIKAREEILLSTIKKEKLKLAGNSEIEKKELVKLMSETSDYFPFAYLVNFVNKVKNVAFERGHKQADKGDIIEGYLQLTTGRPASSPTSEHSKEIVASHEFEHSIGEEWMYQTAKEQKIPWHLGERVNFITLDPRGYFGGAMYPKYGGNEEYSFEKIFSDIVCDFGGHSAEKNFYNIDGSWGITQDIEMATNSAEEAVGIMGQGGHFGKKSIAGMNIGMSEQALQIFEKDRDAILENAKLVSDLITKTSASFNKELTQKYAHLVGTGNCLIHGDDFRKEMSQWFKKQTPEKHNEIKEVNNIILKIIEMAKKGKKFNINAESVSPLVKKLYKKTMYYVK